MSKMSQALKARDYQEASFTAIREAYLKGHRKALLYLATGGGKTYVFCEIAKRTIRTNRVDGTPKKVAIVVRGRKLVDQASKRLFRENTPHGVQMAGHWNYRPNEVIQVCSIDTLRSRNIVLDVDLLIIDEAHLFTSKGDKEYLSKYKCHILAVTATPYCREGLSHLADIMIKPTSMLELIERGYLVPFRYFAPSEPDLSEVETSRTGDFVNDQLEKAMVSGTLSGKIVESWKSIASGLKTILFAVNINHSKNLAQQFRDAGIRAKHCDSDTPDDEREEIIKELENGDIDIICNVGIFCTGVDIPSLKCVVMARPTKSLNLYIQQAGRGTRTAPDKEWCILIDHAGNIKRHGLPTDEPDVDLDGRITQSADKESKQCKLCFLVFKGVFCPDCGPQQKDHVEPLISESDEKLVEIQIEIDPVKRKHKELLKRAKAEGKRPMWASYKLIEAFGLERSRPHLTEAFIERYESKMMGAGLFSSSGFRPITSEVVKDA